MESDEESTVPLQDQRVFGAGIKRKRVPFVPARPDSPLLGTDTSSTSSKIGDRYLSVVFQDTGLQKGDKTPKGFTPEQVDATAEGYMTAVSAEDSTDRVLCEICRLPMEYTNGTMLSNSRPHEASLAHQVCLAHSHPPSHLDRTRKGLQYLSSYGWDPDSRLGLGVAGEGIRVPIKAKPKNNTVGLGAEMQTRKPFEKKQRLDAKQARQKAQEDRRQRERLQELFYRNDDVEKLLGPG